MSAALKPEVNEATRILLRLMEVHNIRTLDMGDGETVDLLAVIERWDVAVDAIAAPTPIATGDAAGAYLRRSES